MILSFSDKLYGNSFSIVTLFLSGITKIASNKYKLNSGSSIKSNSKYTLYPKGGMTTSKYRFVYASEYYILVVKTIVTILQMKCFDGVFVTKKLTFNNLLIFSVHFYVFPLLKTARH